MLKETFSKTRRIYNRKIVLPIVKSQKPTQQIAIGVAIGIFWGLTPTAGLQIYLVLFQWAIHKYIFKFPFALTVALTLIWISNPLTIVPFYFIFYNTGIFIRKLLNFSFSDVTFIEVMKLLNEIFSTEVLNPLEKIYSLLGFLLDVLGITLIVGSLVYAIPGAIASYFFTKKVLLPLKILRENKKKKLL